MVKPEIKQSHDSERNLWRIEVWVGNDCIMSCIAHNEEELAKLQMQATQTKAEIERRASQAN